MTNFLYAQAPNRKGNISKNPAKHEAVKGGTAGVVTHGTQGAPKAAGNVYPVGNKCCVATPTAYNTKTTNDGYLKGSFNPCK
jgi:hypothetical protein